jgi:hypothetical protein
VRPSDPRPVRVDGGARSSLASCDIPVPARQSSLEIALAVIECLVKDHGAVLTEADVRSDGMGTFKLRISRPARKAEG